MKTRSGREKKFVTVVISYEPTKDGEGLIQGYRIVETNEFFVSPHTALSNAKTWCNGTRNP